MFHKYLTTFNLLTLLPAITLAGSLDLPATQGDPASSMPQAETMPNQGTVTIIPTTTDQPIAAGYQNGSGIVKGDPNLHSKNIRAGITIFGVMGTFSGTTTPLPSSSSNRYTDNGNGTVTDNQTGLIWLKNANCFGKQNWETAVQTAANLANGQCGLSDGSRSGMWRLPTIDEWKAMVDNYKKPALSNAVGTGQWTEGDAFLGVQSSWYWSSTAYMNRTAVAWYMILFNGIVSYNSKTITYYVWPVSNNYIDSHDMD